MPATTIMQNDSLAARLFQGHDYKRDLAGEMLQESEKAHLPSVPPEDGPDSLLLFLQAVPWVVWALLGVLILSFFLLWLYRSGLIERTRHAAVALSDNIHEIDFDSEFAEALRKKDYAALVRLVYLSTLHTLDEQGRIVWRIHKTPMEYVAETGDASLMTMTHHFVKVRYGHFAATQGLYDEMSRLQSDIVKGGES